MTRPVALALHSYSRRLRYLHDPNYDVFAFIDEAAARGYDGVNISLSGPDNLRLPTNRHLGGEHATHLSSVADHLRDRELSVELDTATVHPPDLEQAIRTAAQLGASILRTFTHHPWGPSIMEDTVRDLRTIARHAEAAGVVVAVENHEEFTSIELLRIVESVASPNVRLLFDYANSMAVLEPPAAALEVMLPHVVACHMKDVVMVTSDHTPEGVPAVAGVPLGQGSVDLVGLTRKLTAKGLHRIAVQNVWGYHVPLGKLRAVETSSVRLGNDEFIWADPPSDNWMIAFDPETTLTPQTCLELETKALDVATASAQRVLDAI